LDACPSGTVVTNGSAPGLIWDGNEFVSNITCGSVSNSQPSNPSTPVQPPPNPAAKGAQALQQAAQQAQQPQNTNCSATTYTPIATPLGNVLVPQIAPGTHVIFAGLTGNLDAGLGLGAGTGVYRYQGANGNTYRGTYVSFSFGVGAGVDASAGGGISSNLGSFFGPSVSTNGVAGVVGGTASVNGSGSAMSGGLAAGADLSADVNATYPLGAPTRIGGHC
jgi:hypothetical protein